MRKRMVMLAMLAGCAGGCSSEPEPPKKAAAKAASALSPGLWRIDSEVTRLTTKDQGKPSIDTPAGTKASNDVCVAAAEAAKPAPALFAGPKDECAWDNFYLSGGTLNASMRCTRPGLNGQLLVTVYGDYTAESLTATHDLSTHLAGDGDVVIAARLAGRRVGPCPPA